MEETKDKIRRVIERHLDKMGQGLSKPINFYSFKQKGLSEKEIYEILIDYAIKTDLHKLNYNVDARLFFNYKFLNELLNDDKTKEKVINLYAKYGQIYDIKGYIAPLLILSDFNLYFFIGLEGFYDFTRYSNSLFDDILNKITTEKKWNESNVKKFFIYFFNNSAYVAEFSPQFFTHFKYMGETLQRFLVLKTVFIEMISLPQIKGLLNEPTISETVLSSMVTKYPWGDEDLSDIVRFYLDIDEKYQKLFFEKERDFMVWLGGKEKDDEVLSIMEDYFSPEKVEEFFKYNPNWHARITYESGKVDLKYKIKGVPNEIKNSIQLEMTGKYKFDGDEIEKMFYDHRDSPAVWVKYYVEGELFDHTLGWDYRPEASTIKDYYWDDLTKDNLNKIKEILKKENPEIDLNDEDAIKDAALESEQIGGVLYSAAEEGERTGDENKLTKDIENGIDQIFGKGNWERVHLGIIANVDLSSFDEYALHDAYVECGDWEVRCIFTTIRGDYMSNQYKPSLPEYRYGIQGDFDVDMFNDSIANNL